LAIGTNSVVNLRRSRPLSTESAASVASMNFYAQLDSINDEFVLGDVGMVFVFVCFSCQEGEAIIQGY
jgi:hypothetical protein